MPSNVLIPMGNSLKTQKKMNDKYAFHLPSFILIKINFFFRSCFKLNKRDKITLDIIFFVLAATKMKIV